MDLIDCVNIWKRLEAANLVFEWIFVLTLVNHKLFHLGIAQSEEPKKLVYCNYSNFSSKCFKDDFMSSISQEKHDYSYFKKKLITCTKEN